MRISEPIGLLQNSDVLLELFGGEMSYQLTISKAANIFTAPTPGLTTVWLDTCFGRSTRLLPVGLYITLL